MQPHLQNWSSETGDSSLKLAGGTAASAAQCRIRCHRYMTAEMMSVDAGKQAEAELKKIARKNE